MLGTSSQFYALVPVNKPKCLILINLGSTSLIKASEGGHINVVRYLVENGANVNASSNESKLD